MFVKKCRLLKVNKLKSIVNTESNKYNIAATKEAGINDVKLSAYTMFLKIEVC